MASSADLKDIFRAARPLIEQQLDLAEMVAALRDVATEKGLDWSQIKALLKAQIQDERDDNGGKRVKAIVAKAEHASAYADMLGLAKMNEENFSASQSYSEAKGREFPNEAPDLSGAETAELRSLTENQEIETSGGNGPAAAGQTADEASTSSGPVINSQATPPEPADIAGEAPSSSQASPATDTDDGFDPSKITFLRKSAADYRPHCQKPEACGASGLRHCYTCQKAIDVAEMAEHARVSV